MKEKEREELIARVMKMEQCFDELLAAKETDPDSFLKDPEIRARLNTLIDYYENGQWLRDYKCDERGEIPAGLKRGVLSQDAVYDFLNELCWEE